jgi:hypothetical protein
MCATSSACERNWSSQQFIQTKKRTRLSFDRLRDLVYVYHNMRLLDKVHSLDATVELE